MKSKDHRKLEKRFLPLLKLLKQKNPEMYKGILNEKDLRKKSMYLYTIKEIPEMCSKLSFQEFLDLYNSDESTQLDHAIDTAEWNAFVDDMNTEAKEIVKESSHRIMIGKIAEAAGFGIGFGIVSRLLKMLI